MKQMKNIISDIAKELEKLADRFLCLGLKNGGLTGISLFFFFYARFIGDERYEELANNLLENVVFNFSDYMSYFFASEFADIGRTIDLLANEKFLEVEPSEFAVCIEEPLMYLLKKDIGINFGFCTGITGVCDFFLNKANAQEALNITFEHIYSGLNVVGYPKHPIESLFLFPSEILRDVKIFFLKLEKLNIFIPQKELLEQAIRKLESKKILHSNCPEYYVLQDLREAEIMDDQLKIKSSLEIIATSSFDLIFKGLASLSLADNSLPAWWKLV